MPTAIVTGCSGQDGTYLTDLLIRRGYRVFGVDVVEPTAYAGAFAAADIANRADILALVERTQPSEIYHLAAFHHSTENRLADEVCLATSFTVNTLSLEYLLDAIVRFAPDSRLFYPASSRIFGLPSVSPQDESTPFSPVCAYGISKVAGIHLCRMYRQVYSIFACAGILYNHESPLRAPSFITRKLTQAAARASLGLNGQIVVRDSSALVDWGAAEDYVLAMTEMMALPAAEEFIVATGKSHSVREFAQLAFAHVGLDSNDFVHDSPGFGKRGGSIPMTGNAAKLRAMSNWVPRRSLAEIAASMVDHDISLLSNTLPSQAEPAQKTSRAF